MNESLSLNRTFYYYNMSSFCYLRSKEENYSAMLFKNLQKNLLNTPTLCYSEHKYEVHVSLKRLFLSYYLTRVSVFSYMSKISVVKFKPDLKAVNLLIYLKTPRSLFEE